MVYKFKDIDKKNRTFYFFEDMFNIKNLDPNKIKMKIHTKMFLFIT